MKRTIPWIVVLFAIVVAGLVVWSFAANDSASVKQAESNAHPTSTTVSAPTSTPSSLSDLFNVYSVANPDGLLMTDSSGRRTGQDPRTGAVYQEIPNTTYVPQPHGIQLTFTNPPAGIYTIQIVGNHTGQYKFGVSINNGAQQAQMPTYSGSIQPGQIVTYAENYDPSNWASSTLVLENTASSNH